MKRIAIYAVAIVVALIPAVLGLWGNVSFSQDLPVRVPDSAKGAPGPTTATPTPGPVASPTGNGDRDQGRGQGHRDLLTHGTAEAGDGRGSDGDSDDSWGARGHGSDD